MLGWLCALPLSIFYGNCGRLCALVSWESLSEDYFPPSNFIIKNHSKITLHCMPLHICKWTTEIFILCHKRVTGGV